MTVERLETFLDTQAIEYYTDRESKEIVMKICPVCGHGTDPNSQAWKFSFNYEKNCGHCWRNSCSVPNVIRLLSYVFKIKLSEAKKLWMDRDTETRRILIEAKRKRLHNPRVETKDKFKINTSIPDVFSAAHGNSYLISRGVSSEMIERFNLKFCPVNYYVEKLNWINRIIIPVYFNGKLVGWQGRDTTNKSKIKTMNLYSFDKNQYLLNYDKVQQENYIVLTEGPFDAFKMHRYNPVCMFGSKISNRQLELLSATQAKTIFVGIDPEEETRLDRENNPIRLISKTCDELLTFFQNVYVVTPPNGKEDIGACTVNEAYLALKYAKKYVQDDKAHLKKNLWKRINQKN